MVTQEFAQDRGCQSGIPGALRRQNCSAHKNVLGQQLTNKRTCESSARSPQAIYAQKGCRDTLESRPVYMCSCCVLFCFLTRCWQRPERCCTTPTRNMLCWRCCNHHERRGKRYERSDIDKGPRGPASCMLSPNSNKKYVVLEMLQPPEKVKGKNNNRDIEKDPRVPREKGSRGAPKSERAAFSID